MRPNATTIHGETVAVERLPIEEARALVEKANAERAERRQRASYVSEAEIDLLAAFLYYGEHPELQYPVGPYDADFYFPRYKTAVEVDGRDFHDLLRDRRRDRYFADAGIRTIRVPARCVWKDPLKAASRAAQEMVFSWLRAA